MADAVTPPNPANPGAGGTVPRHEPDSPEGQSPDPTLMTIDALRREIAMLENLLNTQIQGAEKVNKERFHRLESLMEAADSRRTEQKIDTKDAVEAALAAQKEATAKMEDSVSSQIDGLRANVETEVRSIRGALADLKDRTTTIESLNQGERRKQADERKMSSAMVAAIGVGITAVLALLAVLSFVVSSL